MRWIHRVIGALLIIWGLLLTAAWAPVGLANVVWGLFVLLGIALVVVSFRRDQPQ